MRIPNRTLPLVVGVIGLAALLALAAAARLVSAALNVGPEQPIPFSHRIHVGTKDLSCFFCHPNAATSSNAGMPSVEKCLLCHNVIASQFPPIAKIRQYERRGQGMPWVRVAVLPDFVHFTHQAHLARRVDCGRCHGNVREMDRIKQVHRFKMGFCVDCHRKNKVSTDCFTCHY